MPKHIYGCIRDKKDLRDHLYYSKIPKLLLPSCVDLRSMCSPVVDQGQLGSCTANAIVSGLKEYQLLQHKQWQALSRLFLYWQERKLEGTVNEDSGATIADGMKVLNKIGVCPEIDWPYDISTFTNSPSDQDVTDAAPYKIAEYHRIISLDLLKAALAEKLPAVIGIAVYESLEGAEATSTGYIPLPNTSKEHLLGGHAVMACGYDDSMSHNGITGYVILKNSWGTQVGDQGYYYLPYAYWNSGFVEDMWTSIR